MSPPAAVAQPREPSSLPRQRGRDDRRHTDNGICWYHNKFQNHRCKTPVIGTAPMPGRETARPPARANGPSGRRPPHPIPNSHSNGDVFSHGSGLMFLRDSYNKLNFLIDSGASISIIPFSSSQTPLGPKLLGANGASIPTWGFQTKTVKIGTNTFEATVGLLFPQT